MLPDGLYSDEYDDPDDGFGTMLKIYGDPYPLTSGTFPVTVTVNSGTDSASRTFDLVIADPQPPLALTYDLSKAVPIPLVKNSLFSGLTLEATGGIPLTGGENLYNWTPVSLPPELILSFVERGTASETMELEGTPTAIGNYSITIQVTDQFVQNPSAPNGPTRPVKVSFDLCVFGASMYVMLFPFLWFH